MTREALREILGGMPQRPAVFVESGTFQARVTQIALEFFGEVHTIEASEPLYRAAQRTLRNTAAHCYLGDSRLVLKRLAADLAGPVVWYLDANGWDYPEVVQDCPVLDELAILAPRTQHDCIIIDEAHAFGTSRPGWGAVTIPKISEVLGGSALDAAHNCAVIYR